MHIVEFFHGLERRPPSPEKVAALEQTFLSSPEFMETSIAGELLNTFAADDAFDMYFSSLMGRPLMGASQCNYPLACLINFGVHQLTMRRSVDTGKQIFVQIGGHDGHEFMCGILRNVHIKCHLVTSGGAPHETVESLLPFLPEKWSGKPEIFDVSPQGYFSANKPNIGLLAIVNLDSGEDYFSALSLAWIFLDGMADVILQGTDENLAGVTETFSKTNPDMIFHGKEFPLLGEGGKTKDQKIVVFQKKNHDFNALIPKQV